MSLTVSLFARRGLEVDLAFSSEAQGGRAEGMKRYYLGLGSWKKAGKKDDGMLTNNRGRYRRMIYDIRRRRYHCWKSLNGTGQYNNEPGKRDLLDFNAKKKEMHPTVIKFCAQLMFIGLTLHDKKY